MQFKPEKSYLFHDIRLIPFQNAFVRPLQKVLFTSQSLPQNQGCQCLFHYTCLDNGVLIKSHVLSELQGCVLSSLQWLYFSFLFLFLSSSFSQLPAVLSSWIAFFIFSDFPLVFLASQFPIPLRIRQIVQMIVPLLLSQMNGVWKQAVQDYCCDHQMVQALLVCCFSSLNRHTPDAWTFQAFQSHHRVYLATKKEPTFFLQKQTSYPHTLPVGTDKWNVFYIYSAIKRNEVLVHAVTWMSLLNIMLNEGSQSPKT